jgi:hypothetical protein
MCFEVNDIIAARDQLKAKGVRALGDGESKIGAQVNRSGSDPTGAPPKRQAAGPDRKG